MEDYLSCLRQRSHRKITRLLENGKYFDKIGFLQYNLIIYRIFFLKFYL